MPHGLLSDKTFTSDDIIRFYLNNLDATEQRAIRLYFNPAGPFPQYFAEAILKSAKTLPETLLDAEFFAINVWGLLDVVLPGSQIQEEIVAFNEYVAEFHTTLTGKRASLEHILSTIADLPLPGDLQETLGENWSTGLSAIQAMLDIAGLVVVVTTLPGQLNDLAALARERQHEFEAERLQVELWSDWYQTRF